jgi:hypothetical protein
MTGEVEFSGRAEERRKANLVSCVSWGERVDEDWEASILLLMLLLLLLILSTLRHEFVVKKWETTSPS